MAGKKIRCIKSVEEVVRKTKNVGTIPSYSTSPLFLRYRTIQKQDEHAIIIGQRKDDAWSYTIQANERRLQEFRALSTFED
ncbi:unnamed protein product [Heligmosomoides polygyrus]|uniref:DUF1330 domain-containing protein n=1 Tax=Heligmosomoides polygyrus TaxID=6339 RepID=A0A183F7W7_HELPZ|nr:unnamed protein product [Heligmosomoides polygyrus]